MNTVFTINFRREAYLRRVAKARRRLTSLGLWLFYFGAVGVVTGLYGLNCVSLAQRTRLLEREVARLRRQPASGVQWRPGRTEAEIAQRYLRDARGWRDRLGRLAELVPPNARLTSLQFNPDNVSGAATRKLVVSGEMRGEGGGDRMQQVMSFVSTLSGDSVFASGYPNVRLVTTRASSTGESAEFVIECR